MNEKRKIVYYVASSLDGFISGPGDDISGFEATSESLGIDQYKKDLLSFDTVIMGRKTYEFGYKYGLKPGNLAYPNMKHIIFSNHLQFEEQDENLSVRGINIDTIEETKSQEGTDIYLCGGGIFAGWLLEHKLIDCLILKLNPFIQGSGTRLFGANSSLVKTKLITSTQYDKGLLINQYDIKY